MRHECQCEQCGDFFMALDTPLYCPACEDYNAFKEEFDHEKIQSDHEWTMGR